jgi:hypothetical protein
LSFFLEVPQPDLLAFQFLSLKSFRLLRRCEPLSHFFIGFRHKDCPEMAAVADLEFGTPDYARSDLA